MYLLWDGGLHHMLHLEFHLYTLVIQYQKTIYIV